MSVTVWVPGDPATKGSFKPYRNSTTGKLGVKNDCRRTKSWQGQIKMACLEKRVQPILSGPVCLTLEWHLKRPKDDWRKDGNLKASAITSPTKKPDIDKLTRAVLDGLTGLAYKDDSQVTELHCKKRYILRPFDRTGLWIVIN